MPVVSLFFGIAIRLHFKEHDPPHFHATYAEQEMRVDIETLRVLTTDMSRRHRRLVLAWAELHQEELREAWERVRRGENPGKIAPLV